MAKPPKLSKLQKEFNKQEEERNRKKPCLACAGTGYYDHNDSPKCSICNGTGENVFDRDTYNGLREIG